MFEEARIFLRDTKSQEPMIKVANGCSYMIARFFIYRSVTASWRNGFARPSAYEQVPKAF
jgi:hypothetical protein